MKINEKNKRNTRYNLHGIDKENAGKYRDVFRYDCWQYYTPPNLISTSTYETNLWKHTKDKKQTLFTLFSAFLHDELVKIHPFIDGNGRTSRLLMNLQLLAYGYPIANLKGDNQTKLFYYASLEQSHIENKPEAFYCLVAQEVKKSLEKYLSLIE